jgi:hypothetical protein
LVNETCGKDEHNSSTTIAKDEVNRNNIAKLCTGLLLAILLGYDMD